MLEVEVTLVKNAFIYIDDSGTRHPDRKPGNKPAHGHDYFSLGGVYVLEEEEHAARKLHTDFLTKWEIKVPLHSVEIRNQSGGFAWVGKLGNSEKQQFFEELYGLMKSVPVIGTACVIDRPGYNARYSAKYGKGKWMLCKSAFSILVERAAKVAMRDGRRLRVYIEKCNKKEDRLLKGYFEDMRAHGMPFASVSSAKYQPAEKQDLKNVLLEFRLKEKSSPMDQLADLYLWPMAMGGYHAENKPFSRLTQDRKLIDCQLEQSELGELGIKYYCFDGLPEQ